MTTPDYDALVSSLESRFEDDLRWIASFDSDRITYKIRYVRDDLKTDLTDRDFQTIVHRSMVALNRDHLEDVYFHLGSAQTSVVEYEDATAVHLYLDGARGVVVKVEGGTPVTLPAFREECLAALGV
jgi:hypothetical protein